MKREEFISEVNARCAGFLQARHAEVNAVSEHAVPLVNALTSLTRGGKKMRPALARLGWQAADGRGDAVVELGVALELFQAAALVHDDVIDRSATRRGLPSAHIRFEQMHRESGFSRDAAHFGTSGAILSGDLSLAWASEAFFHAQCTAMQDGLTSSPLAARTFHRMHTEVITGQYLDVLEEVRIPAETEAEAVHRARGVLRYKAAKYSTEYPVVLGAALAGGSDELCRAFAAAALPVGEAFQLRDDLLGVFGDPETTGKPVGDDLREGKRTELIAYGLFRSSATASRELAQMLGDPGLSETQVERARAILVESGALAEVERSIEALTEDSVACTQDLIDLGVSAEVLEEFDQLRGHLVLRTV
ncbi:polyprenyl synthetase family protein [Nesterenkonia jeotgali]|uniref:Geranylgeranyl diphosphate synthase type I n=1 Tax=Nesterenkonia jeotgali TaxID=317018 RepID=A0A839FWK5_9MICC|nr:polyprenyl synthetase family protein [Nesterenkonia jeotgali]MBA8921147.1 geranylgeranyl diphosphate synthase type I [Nesterenkonia jeotgali]